MKNFTLFLAALPCAIIPAIFAGFIHLILTYGILTVITDEFWKIVVGVILVVIFAYADNWIQSFYPYLAYPFFKIVGKHRQFMFLQKLTHFIVLALAVYLLFTYFPFKCLSQYIFAGVLCAVMFGLHWDYCKKGTMGVRGNTFK